MIEFTEQNRSKVSAGLSGLKNEETKAIHRLDGAASQLGRSIWTNVDANGRVQLALAFSVGDGTKTLQVKAEAFAAITVKEITTPAAEPGWTLDELAARPERIAAKLRIDPEFKAAYCLFLTELISLGTGTLSIKNKEKLQGNNQSAFKFFLENEAVWQANSSCSLMLDALSVLENNTLSLNNRNVDEALNGLVADMRARPEIPVCWTINGNNHFPTHQKLADVVKTIGQERKRLNQTNSLQVRNIIVISGNAAQNTSYGPGPLGKISRKNGQLVGGLSEAEAICSLLFAEPDLANTFEVIKETGSLNTGENLVRTAAELKQLGKDCSSVIALNSQSGFSGLRSALTIMGWQNSGHLPQTLHFINPDLSVEEALESPSYEFVGKTFLQAMREFINFASYLSRELFIPPVPVPQALVANCKLCLRKIGIDPDHTSPSQMHTTLSKMHALAMSDVHDRLIGAGTSYGVAIVAAKNLSAQKRALQDALARARDAARKQESSSGYASS